MFTLAVKALSSRGRAVETSTSVVPTCTAIGLPDGLSMSSDGVISGAVMSLGTHTVTVTAPDDYGDPRSVTFDWIVL
jgi:hypothetical protein